MNAREQREIPSELSSRGVTYENADLVIGELQKMAAFQLQSATERARLALSWSSRADTREPTPVEILHQFYNTVGHTGLIRDAVDAVLNQSTVPPNAPATNPAHSENKVPIWKRLLRLA